MKDKINKYFKKEQYKANQKNVSKNRSTDGKNSLVQPQSSKTFKNNL